MHFLHDPLSMDNPYVTVKMDDVAMVRLREDILRLLIETGPRAGDRPPTDRNFIASRERLALFADNLGLNTSVAYAAPRQEG